MVFVTMANEGTTFISSSTINQLFHNGVDISPLVPEAVAQAFAAKKKK